jgi:glucosamine-6-phosphate deaminase
MQEYRISKEELVRWCQIPADELANNPKSKVDFRMFEEKSQTFAAIGDMMADDVIANNKEGRPTKWVLCSGPNEQYKTFIRRVHDERISLKNVWVFQMDETLDWQGRHYPVLPIPGSCEGRMNKIFYDKIDDGLNVPTGQRFFVHTDKLDFIDEKIAELGGLDTVWAGVGYKGLIGCNETPINPYNRITLEEFADSKTRIVAVNPDTIIAYSERNYGGMYDMCEPMMATIGFKSLLTARKAVYMITTGSWKQTVLRVAMFSEPTLEYPVTLFPARVPSVVLFCDRATAVHPLSKDEKNIVNEYSVPGLFK